MFNSLNILEVNTMSQLPSQALPPTNQSEAEPHQSHHPLPHHVHNTQEVPRRQGGRSFADILRGQEQAKAEVELIKSLMDRDLVLPKVKRTVKLFAADL